MLNKYLQLIDICMQLFAGELTNQNREYYKVNDNINYLIVAEQVFLSMLTS